MRASVLLDACLREGIDFFTGVPDSYLKGLCNELYARYGTDGPVHIVAHNEGGAIGLCAGHFLACGRPALCYMQNSGLGNTVNPLTSLMDSRVYSIPCLLIVGWRGEPGTKDEPQHVRQGAVTLSQLDLLDIPYRILSADTTEEEFFALFNELLAVLKAEKPAALVVRKGALTTDAKPDWGNAFPMARERAAELILHHTGESDILVSTTGKLSREVFELREKAGQGHDRDFLTVGSMGHASMIALRLAEEKPDRRVWCLDGDGAVMMHLGAMPLIGRRAPKNLVHVVVNNGAHETVGGMPVCSGAMNIHALAEAAGYPVILRAENEESLTAALKEALAANGPVLLEVCCACGARDDLGRPTTTPLQNRDALMAFVTKSSQF
ncbi:MAG: phosphonopyruvate decarboxylase [Clostridiales bacterium]|nr:phosphonopyruvate decarboxylase [Clostridiales bacterium]